MPKSISRAKPLSFFFRPGLKLMREVLFAYRSKKIRIGSYLTLPSNHDGVSKRCVETFTLNW